MLPIHADKEVHFIAVYKSLIVGESIGAADSIVLKLMEKANIYKHQLMSSVADSSHSSGFKI